MNRVHRRQKSRSSGQTVITFALVLVLFLFGLFACVVDLAVLYAQQTQLAKAAQDAAIAGASAVDVDKFIASGGTNVVLKASAARTLCVDALTADLPGVSIDPAWCHDPAPATPYKYTTQIQHDVVLPINFGVGTSVQLVSSYSALAQCGTLPGNTAELGRCA